MQIRSSLRSPRLAPGPEDSRNPVVENRAGETTVFSARPATHIRPHFSRRLASSYRSRQTPNVLKTDGLPDLLSDLRKLANTGNFVQNRTLNEAIDRTCENVFAEREAGEVGPSVCMRTYMSVYSSCIMSR